MFLPNNDVAFEVHLKAGVGRLNHSAAGFKSIRFTALRPDHDSVRRQVHKAWRQFHTLDWSVKTIDEHIHAAGDHRDTLFGNSIRSCR